MSTLKIGLIENAINLLCSPKSKIQTNTTGQIVIDEEENLSKG
jgi:hypothetical protein